MKAYKLLRVMANGELASLFINKKVRLPLDEWLDAEAHPTSGFKLRPYWHCLTQPEAPHMTMEGRRWYKVEVRDFTFYERPVNQGSTWVLANQMKILEAV